MNPELLQELNELLGAAKAGKTPPERLTLVDLVMCTRELRGGHKERLARLVAGGKISRADAARRIECLNQFYHSISEIADTSRTQLEAAKAELERRSEKIYVPR